MSLFKRYLAEYERAMEAHDRSHNGPYDRGGADAYYGRQFRPHKWVEDPDNPGQMMKVDLTDPAEIEAYRAGYSEETGRKDYGEGVEMEDLLKRKDDLDDEDREFLNKKKHQRKEISELLKLAGLSEEGMDSRYDDDTADGFDLKTADLNTMIDVYAQEQDEDIANKILDAIRTRFGEEAAAHAEVHHGNPSQMIPDQQSQPLPESDLVEMIALAGISR